MSSHRNLEMLDRYKEELLVEGVWSNPAICSQLLDRTQRVEETYKIMLIIGLEQNVVNYQWKPFRREVSHRGRASKQATDIPQLSGRKQIPFIGQCHATNTSASGDKHHIRKGCPEGMIGDKQ